MNCYINHQIVPCDASFLWFLTIPFILIGLFFLIKPDLFIKYQIWSQKFFGFGNWQPSKRIYTFYRIFGLIFLVIGLVFFGIILSQSFTKNPVVMTQKLQPANSLTKMGELLLPNGETYKVLAGKFSTPYEITYRNPDYAFDLGNPTDVLDALTTFAWWGNKKYPQYMEKYLSLVDSGVKTNLLQTDKESGGKYFEAREVIPPTKNDIDTMINKIFFWVELNKNGKTYRVLVGTSTDQQGKVYPGLSFTLVKNGNQWLQSLDLDTKNNLDNPQNSVSFNIVSSTSYEEFVNKLK